MTSLVAKLKKIPVPFIVAIVLVLLYPAFVMLEHSRLKARFDNNCLDPRKDLEICYVDYYHDSAEKLGTIETLKQLHERKEVDAVLGVNCHEAMHEIGHEAFNEYGSIGEAYAHADYSCWGGYLHGVVEESMRGRSLDDIGKDELNSMCDVVKGGGEKSFEHFSCVHGLGHALMFVSNNELLKVISHCDDLNSVWEARQCANGAFMQNMFSNYNDHVSDFTSKEDMHVPCNLVREDLQDVCYQVQGKLILDRLTWDFDKAFTFCAGLPTATTSAACVSGLGAAVSNFSAYKPQKISTLCAKAPNGLDQDCLYGAITDLEGVVGDTTLGRQVCSFQPVEKQATCYAIAEKAHVDFPGKATNE